jgi:mono/diheme cytochrome c family protein
MNKTGWIVFCLFGIFLLLQSNCTSPYKQGEALYKQYCIACHMKGGEGLSALIPPLNGADYLTLNRNKIPCIIKHGIQDSILVNGTWYDYPMEGIATLSEVEITNIINYVFTSWSNQIEPISINEVKEALETCNKK